MFHNKNVEQLRIRIIRMEMLISFLIGIYIIQGLVKVLNLFKTF